MYEDRTDAGKKLAEKLMKYKNSGAIIVALPRGGVVVGYEISQKLNIPLEVLIVRKLGAPQNPEMGIGAISTGNVLVLNEEVIKTLDMQQKDLDQIIDKEKKELLRRCRLYRGSDKLPCVTGKTVILTDDGMATGVTVKAAVLSLFKVNPRKIILALPVCTTEAKEETEKLLRTNDELLCLEVSDRFSSIGEWYRNFDQVTDKMVVNYLN